MVLEESIWEILDGWYGFELIELHAFGYYKYNYFDIPITQTLIHFLIYQIDWIVLVRAQNDQK